MEVNKLSLGELFFKHKDKI